MRATPARRHGPRRLARVLGLDANPLRRASDRAEAWIRIGVLAAFLVAGPLATIGAWHWADRSGTAGTSASAGSWHGAQAIVLPPASPAADAAAGRMGGQVRVREPGQVASQAVLAAELTPVLVALALLTVLRLAQRRINKRRLAAWDAAWSAIGPQWTGRGP